jgi:hypothetical protein
MVTRITPLRSAPSAPVGPAERGPEAHIDAPVAGSDRLSRNVVIGSLVTMVVIRLFTEVIPVLPRFFNFVDVPIVGGLVLYSVIAPNTERSRARLGPAFGGYLIALIALWGVSLVFNGSRVAPMPALLFIYLVASPVLVYLVVYRIWPVGQAGAMSKAFVRLALLQFVVVVVIDLPRFAANQNPDSISGTFGENAYQLVFFLVLFGALLAGIVTFEPRRRAARFAIPLGGATLLVIFLAQYRALLVGTFVAILTLGLLLARSRGRGMLVGAAAVAAVFLMFTLVLSQFPVLRFDRAVSAIREEPGALVVGKVDAVRHVGEMFNDDPRLVLTGAGGGTYSSRAWRTFSLVDEVGGHADVAGPYVQTLTGESYTTDVSVKYVLPQLTTAGAILGSEGLATPFSSYVALLAELGLGGLLLIVALYVGPFLRCLRMAVFAMTRARPGDPLPALLLASTVAFLTLLQMGFLDNWLETTRVTFTAWILFAVAHKEFRARLQPLAQPVHPG